MFLNWFRFHRQGFQTNPVFERSPATCRRCPGPMTTSTQSSASHRRPCRNTRSSRDSGNNSSYIRCNFYALLLAVFRLEIFLHLEV